MGETPSHYRRPLLNALPRRKSWKRIAFSLSNGTNLDRLIKMFNYSTYISHSIINEKIPKILSFLFFSEWTQVFIEPYVQNKKIPNIPKFLKIFQIYSSFLEKFQIYSSFSEKFQIYSSYIEVVIIVK